MLFLLWLSWTGRSSVPEGPLSAAMALAQSELDAAMSALAERENAPYYTAITVREEDEFSLSASDGALNLPRRTRERSLDVDMRVGSIELDNTHPLRGFSGVHDDGRRRSPFPIDDSPAYAQQLVLRRELDRSYRFAEKSLLMVRGEQEVKTEEEDAAPDFEPREGIRAIEPVAAPLLDEIVWQDALLRLNQRMNQDPRVESTDTSLSMDVTNIGFVDSEGAHLEHGRVHLRLSASISARAPDGDRVRAYRSEDVHAPDRLDPKALDSWADPLVAELHALLDAPRGDVWSGPVLLRGEAAGVFFHEVLGHRAEGHRQKNDFEGKTFKTFVGRAILPDFVDVVDDPTLARFGDEDLNGYYRYDDEGVPAQRADLVLHGVLRGFLMGRSPLADFPRSNGHGRRAPGHLATSRMANLIVRTDAPQPFAKLRQQLLDAARAGGLPFGLIIDDIDGGFTLTGRGMPNAFNVRARAGWRVYADGRPDERVRGIDLVGTPLAAFESLSAAGDDPAVFNGYCGAESGYIPVSAVSPSLLFRSLEVQLKEKGTVRPPILPKPTSATPPGDA